jgi:hypothetical protein
MNRTKRAAAIGLLCIGTSALSFGDFSFTSLDPDAWNNTYTADTSLFGAIIQQSGYSLQSGLPSGNGNLGTAFTSGAGEDFNLTYDPVSQTASLTIGNDATLTVGAPAVAIAGGGLDHVGIALSTGTSDESIAITNIMLNNVDSDNLVSNNGQLLLDFTMTPSTDLSGGQFTLTGNIDMSWNSSTAPGTGVSAEIVGADAVRLPEPGTWMLLGSALGGLGLSRRKRIF